MFKKNTLLEIDKKKIYINRLNKKNVFKKTIRITKDKEIRKEDLTNSKLKVCLKNRNIFMLLEEEKIFIKLITIPKVKGKSLDTIIKGEIKCYFKYNKDIIYSYNIYKEYEKTLEVLLFCVKWDDIFILRDFLHNNNSVKSIWLVQICFLQYCKDRFKEEDFIFSFIFKDNLYLLACKNGKLINNNIIKKFYDYEFFYKNLYEFIEDCNDKKINLNLKSIYIANFKDKFELFKEGISYKIHNLGNINREELINF
ncbi:hypothetical protein [Clostridium rectalis]|uniref:hypothetical protein n=1 Tax=Clostridium rectalis TaxID=2040295 RepID=UPI000F6450FD|nr:hypothetical protein [Clostridium rectalis]